VAKKPSSPRSDPSLTFEEVPEVPETPFRGQKLLEWHSGALRLNLTTDDTKGYVRTTFSSPSFYSHYMHVKSIFHRFFAVLPV
jgi:hypothetical protein